MKKNIKKWNKNENWKKLKWNIQKHETLKKMKKSGNKLNQKIKNKMKLKNWKKNGTEKLKKTLKWRI